MPLIDDIRDLIEHDMVAANALLRTLSDSLPNSFEARQLRGLSHLRRLEFPEAISAFQEALEIDPNHDETRRNVAFCQVAAGDYDAALATYQDAFRRHQSAGALRFIGLLLHRSGQTKDAVRTYERLLATCIPTSPEIPLALQGLSAALRDLGMPLAADRATSQLIERCRRDPIPVSSGLVSRNNSEDFHEWSHYADKSRLAARLNARRAVDPAGRFPETFVLPQDRAALQTFAAGPDAPPLYIVKPTRGSGGQGITVTSDITPALDRTDVVVQRYIDRPYLIEGRKGHCRIYGLVTSTTPLRAYVYSEGIVRIAPEPYDPASGGGSSMHVTNTALHTGHPGLEICQDPSQDDVGSIRSLTALLRRLTADGLDGQATFGEIKALMEWVVRMLAADGLFDRQAARGPARSFPPKLFGLDVLIDAEGHPWLIEMQRTPAAAGAPLVERINAEMYLTGFRMAQGLLLDDSTPPEVIQALRQDNEARRQREAAIETANRGGFVPLDL